MTDRTKPRPDVSLEAQIAAVKSALAFAEHRVLYWREYPKSEAYRDASALRDATAAALATLEAARWRLNRDWLARALHKAHMPFCDYTYPFEHPMSSRHVYEALADAVIALPAPPSEGERDGR